MKKGLLWLSLLVAVILGATWQYYPLQNAKARLDAFPIEGLGFQGIDIPVTDFEKKYLKDTNLLKRFYEIGRDQIYLTAIDGTNNRGAVHDPSYCFTGGGWHIERRELLPLANGEVEKITMTQEGKPDREVLVWFSAGERPFASVLEYWLATTMRRLTLGWSGQEPVRVIVQPVADENPDWKRLIRDFVPLKEL